MRTRDGAFVMEHELEKAEAEAKKWGDFNWELLRQMFDSDEYANSYIYSRPAWISSPYGDSAATRVRHLEESLQRQIEKLESIKDRLSLIPEAPSISAVARPVSVPRHGEVSKRVFIVHGHDEVALGTVRELLERLGLQPVILRELPNAGRTVIEKFEDYADVGFAVVLLTPDDTGHPTGAPDQAQPRARQNVILELGFFLGRLGREKVCPLYKTGVVIPSDYHGVLYVEMDESGGWQVKLAKELKHAGLHIDFSQVPS